MFGLSFHLIIPAPKTAANAPKSVSDLSPQNSHALEKLFCFWITPFKFVNKSPYKTVPKIKESHRSRYTLVYL